MPEIHRGETQAEHRRYPRLRLKLWVHYQCLERGTVSHRLESLAEDLGAGGLAMRSDRALGSGQLVLATLFLPPAELRAGEENTPIVEEKDCVPIPVLCRVVWSAPREDQYMNGLQFLDLQPQHRKLLKAFLVDFDLDQPESDLYTS